MDSIIYKVIFKAIQQFENKNLTLIFRNLTFEKPLTILNLTDLSDKSENIIFFQNIEEVITLGNINPSFDYNYYKVILFIQKSNGEKKGYLIEKPTLDLKSAEIDIPEDSPDYVMSKEELVKLVDTKTREFNDFSKKMHPEKWELKFKQYLKKHPEDANLILGRVT